MAEDTILDSTRTLSILGYYLRFTPYFIKTLDTILDSTRT